MLSGQKKINAPLTYRGVGWMFRNKSTRSGCFTPGRKLSGMNLVAYILTTLIFCTGFAQIDSTGRDFAFQGDWARATSGSERLLKYLPVLSIIQRSWLENNLNIIIAGLVMLILVLLVIFIWNIVLRRRMKIQTQALRASESQFRSLVNSMEDIVYTMDSDLHLTAVYGAFERLGWSLSDCLGKSVQEIFGPQGQNVHRSAGKRVLLGESVVCEWAQETPTGDCYLHTSFSPLRNERGIVVGIVGVGRDITELKQREDASRESEAHYRFLAENMVDVIWVLNTRQMKFSYLSPSVKRLLGYSIQEMQAKRLDELITAKSLKKINRLLERVISGYSEEPSLNQFPGEEIEHIHRDGSIVLTEATTSLMRNAQGEIEIIGVSRDISERKRDRDKLERQSRHYQLLMQTAQDAIHIMDLHGNLLEWNDAFLRHLGYTAEEAAHLNITDWDIQWKQDEIIAILNSILFESKQFNTRHRRKNGEIREAEIYASAVEVDGHWLIYAASRDITQQKKNEQELQQNQARLQAMLNAIPDMIFVYDREGKCLDYHAPDPMLLAVRPNEVIGSKLGDSPLSQINNTVFGLFEKSLQTGEIQVFEYELDLPIGAHQFEARIASIDEQRLLVIVRDITQRKQTEEMLQSSIEEKELLLKEVHHRVKNNMQVMVSLLSLQVEQIKDPVASAVFLDSLERIHAMALVHEKLYKSPDLARVNFGEYILEIASRLVDIFQPSHRVEIKVNAENAWLGVDTAIPCGLIVNELLSNALKYAYPKGETGVVEVVFQTNNQSGFDSRPGKSERYRLVVKDDGVGIPDDVDPSNTKTLGLKLVNILADQMRGKLEIDRQNGTKFELFFNDKEDFVQ